MNNQEYEKENSTKRMQGDLYGREDRTDRSYYKKYKECTVLDDVSLSIRIGDVIGLVGGNGAGKTTLMRAIAGSIPVDSGEIIFQENEELRM